MAIKVPIEIRCHCFLDNISHMASDECSMMFEALLTDTIHQLLKVIDFANCDSAVNFELICCEITFTESKVSVICYIKEGTAI